MNSIDVNRLIREQFSHIITVPSDVTFIRQIYMNHLFLSHNRRDLNEVQIKGILETIKFSITNIQNVINSSKEVGDVSV